MGITSSRVGTAHHRLRHRKQSSPNGLEGELQDFVVLGNNLKVGTAHPTVLVLAVSFPREGSQGKSTML